MNKQEHIKYCQQRISKIEERIEELANKGFDYSKETKQRKNLLNWLKKLEDTKIKGEGK